MSSRGRKTGKGFSKDFIHARTASSPGVLRSKDDPLRIQTSITQLNEYERNFDASRRSPRNNVELTTRVPILNSNESDDLEENVADAQRRITHLIMTAPPTPPVTPNASPARRPFYSGFNLPDEARKNKLDSIPSMDSINTFVERDDRDDEDEEAGAGSLGVNSNSDSAHSWSSIVCLFYHCICLLV